MAGGRQREFDKQEALNQAMKVFWKKGYVGASLCDLTDSMGINKPSMYAAFGNKEQLFIQATENYIENHAAQHAVHLTAPEQTVRQRLEAYLLSALRSQCHAAGPKGCYISLCVTEAASEELPSEANQLIKEVRDLGEQTLLQFFTDAQQAGQLAAHHQPQLLARFYITVLHGTAAMARADQSLTALQTVIAQSLQVLTD